MKANIQTDLKKVYTKFSVDEPVINWLKESTEIIFDIIQKAAQDNRFEIVDSGLGNITDLANEYIEARIEYSTEQDGFLIYIREKLIDTKNLVRKDSHPKIMLSIAKTARDISISSLNIKPIRATRGENFIPFGYIDLLSSILLSPEILKDTSYAPMSAVNFLVDIAKKAIDKDFPRTATVVTDRLGNIAVTTTKLHFLYGDILAGKANWGLVTILDYLLSRLDKLTIYPKYEVESILEQIDKSFSTYLEDDIKYHYSMRSNIKTFFGALAEHGLASLFINALQTKRDDKYLNIVLEALEDFLVDINQSVMKGMNNSKYLDIREILENIYLIGIVFVSVTKNIKDPRLKSEMVTLLDRNFYLPFINAISMSFKQDTNRYTIFDDEYIHDFFSFIGIMFYENKGNLYDKVLEKWAEEVIKIIQKYKNQTTIEHDGHIFEKHEITGVLSDLYKYLRLVGAWFNEFIPDSPVTEKIINELKSQPDITIRRDVYGEFSKYPIDMLGFMNQTWMVQRPFLPYTPKYFLDVDEALTSEKIIKAFEQRLSKSEKGKKGQKGNNSLN